MYQHILHLWMQMSKNTKTLSEFVRICGELVSSKTLRLRSYKQNLLIGKIKPKDHNYQDN